MIFRADKSDAEQMKLIWQQVFDDEKDIIDKFFSLVYEKSIAYVWRENGEIVSVLYMIPMSDGGMYLYSLATLSPYRGRKIMTSLIKHSLLEADRLGADYAFLIPAESSLCSYYERFGFNKRLPMLNIKFDGNVETQEITVREYLMLAKSGKFSLRDDNTEKDTAVMEYVLYEHLSEGHGLVKILSGGVTAGVAVVTGPDNDKVMHYALDERVSNLIKISEDKNAALAAELKGKAPEFVRGYIPF